MRSLEEGTALCILRLQESSMALSKSLMFNFSAVTHAIKTDPSQTTILLGEENLIHGDFSRHILFHIQALFPTNFIQKRQDSFPLYWQSNRKPNVKV